MATHTDEELALLGVLATGFESRQQQTNGLHIGETAGRRAHAMVLDLQRRVEDAEGPGTAPAETRGAGRPSGRGLLLLVPVLALAALIVVLLLR
ncbi:MAG TPA: hypothetical protein VF423_12900 [Actinomycetes bacterium]